MKYCVSHNLRFETPAKRDNFDAGIAPPRLYPRALSALGIPNL